MKWLDLKVEDAVAVLTMDHEKENRFNADFTAEVRAALAEVANAGAAKALVITGGHEKFFCNGLDLNWMTKQDPDALQNFLIDATQLLKDTALFPKPLIGAINGHTFGLGCIWASGFDFRIMRADRGWACFPEMDVNIPFLPGMIAICEHGVGAQVFREMAWTASRYAGPEAVKIGWARETAPADALLGKAKELAAFMGKKQPRAFSVTKQRSAAHVARIIDQEDPVAIRSAASTDG